MTHAALTDEDINCLYGSLRRLLHEQRSGIIRSIAGEAGFDLGQIPDGTNEGGGIQRAPILSSIDGQWSAMDQSRRARLLPRFAEALARDAGLVEVNNRIRKCGFRFEGGGLVPVNAAGEIPT